MGKFSEEYNEAFEVRSIDHFLSRRISEIRKTKGMSLQMVASQLEISTGLLNEYESASRRMPAILLYRAAEVLCVNLSLIFSNKE